MYKDDINSSAGTNADSEQKDQDLSVSQHSIKPNVSGLPSSTPVISYFCQNENRSCLDGLSQDEKFSFMSIVQKQFNKGIKVAINYSDLAL